MLKWVNAERAENGSVTAIKADHYLIRKGFADGATLYCLYVPGAPERWACDLEELKDEAERLYQTDISTQA